MPYCISLYYTDLPPPSPCVCLPLFPNRSPRQGIHITKRDMFYTDVKLFKDQVNRWSAPAAIFSFSCTSLFTYMHACADWSTHTPRRFSSNNPNWFAPPPPPFFIPPTHPPTHTAERVGRGAGRRGLHAQLHPLLPQRRGLGEGLSVPGHRIVVRDGWMDGWVDYPLWS